MRQAIGLNITQHRLNILHQDGSIRGCDVDHMEQQIGVSRLLEGRLKGLHERRRQVGNKSYRVGEQHRAKLLDIHSRQRGVEGGK